MHRDYGGDGCRIFSVNPLARGSSVKQMLALHLAVSEVPMSGYGTPCGLQFTMGRFAQLDIGGDEQRILLVGRATFYWHAKQLAYILAGQQLFEQLFKFAPILKRKRLIA